MDFTVGFSADVRDGVRPWEQLLQEGGIGVVHVLWDLSEQMLQVFIRLQMICLCGLDQAVNCRAVRVGSNGPQNVGR